MASTINADDGVVSGSAGVKTSADNSGVLELQSNGTTQFTLGSSSVVINEAGADVDFRVESDTNTHALFVQGSDGYVGVGTNAPSYPFHVVGSGDTVAAVTGGATSVAALNLGNSTNLADGGIRYDNNTDALIFRANNGEKARIDSAGNLGLGVTPSAWSLGKAIEVNNPGNSIFGVAASQLTITQNAYFNSAYKYGSSAEASRYDQAAGQHIWFTAPSGTANNNITFTQAMTLDASGNLTVAGDLIAGSTAGGGKIYINSATGFSPRLQEATNAMAFYTANTERARITSGGDFCVGQTSSGVANTGASLVSNGRLRVTTDDTEPMEVNRKTSDGKLIIFYQDTVEEGNVSVSGSAVSYNGGNLSRWSQTTDNTRIELLKGTVMSNLDQMAVWINPETGEPYPNEQLNCMKVSDVEGDVNVAGVFVNWDNDDDVFANDMNVAMTGDLIIRIAQGVTVQRGDLLMSAGDGTAKPQGDDIIRSKTIAKVTSNHVTCTYDDGSYCVPCVLMAC